MHHFTIHKRQLGVWFTETGEAVAQVWAPGASAVALELSDGTLLPLTADTSGYWTLGTDRLRPGDTYRIRLNDRAFADPASLAQPDGVHGPSQALDTRAFTWHDSTWTNPSLADYVLYELHTGTFTPDGTLTAIADKLDYLLELGVTAIELMPVAQFPGTRNWGYDGVFPFCVQHSYGGAAALQQLVDTCHQKGIAVVLDVVYNHLGPEGAVLHEFGPYFTDRYQTPWGQAINFDGPDNAGVRRFFIENALMWLRDFHIDALRLDATHAIHDCGPVHLLRELRERVDELTAETGRRHYLIAELDLNQPCYIDPIQKGGYGMHAQWLDGFHHALRVAAGGERTGYYEAFNGVEHLAKSYRDAYVYDGQYSPTHGRPFGAKVGDNPGYQFVTFTQNHDQVGNRMRGERPGQLFSFGMQKLMAGAVLTSPFLPMLFMGEEWSETNPFQYFVSHTDPDLIQAVREGRSREFAALHVDGKAPDPQDEATFRRSTLQWELLDREPHRTLIRYYRALLTLRRTQPVLQSRDRSRLTSSANADRQTLCLHRWHESTELVCLMNFSTQPQAVSLPESGPDARWQKLFDSEDEQWTGNLQDGPAETRTPQATDRPDPAETVTLLPESLVIYSRTL